MKNVFDVFISKLDMVEERHSESYDISIKTSKIEKKEKTENKKNRTSKACETILKMCYLKYMSWKCNVQHGDYS